MNRALLQQALDALVYHTQQTRPIHNTDIAIDALRTELAKPGPKPIGWLIEGTWDFFPGEHPDDGSVYEPLFTKDQL